MIEEATLAELEAERQKVLKEIEGAFETVVRGDGISWSESEIIDLYGSESQRRMARRKDREHGWKSLLDNLEWNPEVGVGGFVFLDAAGFRYYLPAAMARCLREKEGWLTFERLSHSLNWSVPQLHKDNLEQSRLLDLRQRQCVALFLVYSSHRYAAERGNEEGWWAPLDQNEWAKALENHWNRYLSFS